MKNSIIITLLALLMAAPLFAQTDSVRLAEYLKVEQTDARQWIERYQRDIDAYIDENRRADDLSCDALFIGSSSINMWQTLHEDMAPMKVIRRSYGGSSIRDMLYNYDVIARGYNPNCIVMYVENDLCGCKEEITEYEAFDLFRVFAQRIQRDYPGVPFYIVSFKPSFARWDQVEKQKITNYLLKSYADNTPDVEFIDIATAMYDKQGNLREDIFLNDRLHLNATGYEIWTSIIKPRIMQHHNKNLFYYKVGDYEVYLLSEGQGPGNIDILLGASQEMMNQAIPNKAFPTATNTFLLKTPDGYYILIDTGYGSKLFNNLSDMGIKPEEISSILLTHTHGDHTGGLLKDGERAFGNAAIGMSREELEFWKQNDNPKNKAIWESYTIHTFEGKDINEVMLNDEVPIQPVKAFGHTPGHSAILISSKGERLMIWGDLTHAMAIQMPYPQVATTYDSDPDMAIQSRLKILAFVAEHKIPIAGMHIPFPAIGTIEADGEGYIFRAKN